MTEHEALNNLVAACVPYLQWNGPGSTPRFDLWTALEDAAHDAQKVLIENIGGKHGVQSGRLRLGKRRVGQKRPSNRKGNCGRVDNGTVLTQAYERYKRRKAAHQRAFVKLRTASHGRKFEEAVKGLYYPQP
jgi:hypothetical protein